MEVVRGGGSVLYGSEATGGVINIITKKQKENFVKAAIGNYGQQQYSGSFQAGKMGLSYKYSKWGTINDMASEGKNWKGPENNNFDLTYAFAHLKRDVDSETDYSDYGFWYDTLFGYGAYFYDDNGDLVNPAQYIQAKDGYKKSSH